MDKFLKKAQWKIQNVFLITIKHLQLNPISALNKPEVKQKSK